MSQQPVPSALTQFLTATAGRNMTMPAYLAVAIGVATMVMLTVDPAYEASHHWIDVLLWACLGFFAFEWAVRIRASFRTGRPYLATGRGLLDTASVIAVPIALAAGAEPKTAWLLAILWFLKVIPGIPGLRQLRRVLVLESGPLLSVLVLFLVVVFLGSVAEYFLERDVQPQTFGSVPAALWCRSPCSAGWSRRA
jgi:voltage-gated potassium channel